MDRNPQNSFQDMILALHDFWSAQGCLILQPYDMRMGAGTFHTATTLRALGPEPWNAAFVQPCRRPTDGRYGENPNRLQHYYQYQVILKPSPPDIQNLYLESLRVIGIDPADMHADVLAHSNFQHRRCRGRDLKRRAFQGIRWLFADSNVAPQHTLDTVEDIVTHSLVNVHGMLLTLKLPDWNLVSDLPAHMARIRGWGYAYVKARQLSQGSQEVCVFALRRRSTLRRPNKNKPAQQRQGPRASVDQQP